MTTSHRTRRSIALPLAGVAVFAVLILAANSGSDEPAPPATDPAPTHVLTEERPMTTNDDVRAARVEEYVLTMHDADSTAGALIADPDGWVGYVSEYRVDGDRITVRLQAPAAELESRPERAANWIRSAVTPDIAGDFRWVVVEDATGTVVEQQQFTN